MLQNINLLHTIAHKSQKIILGLMSGTSLDGLDIALCKVSGSATNTTVDLLNFKTIEYNSFFKKEIQQIFCKENVSLENVCLLNNYIAKVHAQYINETLLKWNISNTEVDVIASHGQTIYHSPKHKHTYKEFDNATLQIGDADIIAHNTGVITISDFRQKHIAAGGTGAPLAMYGDYFLLSSKIENRILLNIGGIANFTYLSSTQNFDDIICTDVGAGNTLMDTYISQQFNNLNFDIDGNIAAQGFINERLLSCLLEHPFFSLTFPKSTGQEIFNIDFLNNALVKSNTQGISKYDIVATLNMFTATCIADAIHQTIKEKNYIIYVSGGGAKNKTLIKNLQILLPEINIHSVEKLGINADAKEAILFAVLANETLCGTGLFYNKSSSNYPKITMGKISFPS